MPQLVEQPELMQVKLELKIVNTEDPIRSQMGQINEQDTVSLSVSERSL